ncbi:MAG: hypothetical protein AAF417_07890 [Pseudomonadota bacterium]
MSITKKLVQVTAVSLLALPIFANAQRDLPFAEELNSCVAAVNARLDLESVERIRHTVTREKRTGIGYALTIDTAVFYAGDERHYSAYCVAQGNNEPVKFRFETL